MSRRHPATPLYLLISELETESAFALEIFVREGGLSWQNEPACLSRGQNTRLALPGLAKLAGHEGDVPRTRLLVFFCLRK